MRPEEVARLAGGGGGGGTRRNGSLEWNRRAWVGDQVLVIAHFRFVHHTNTLK